MPHHHPSPSHSLSHTCGENSTLGRRLVWRSLAHLSLYQTVSPSLQRRCLFEECATVGRMNLHDELGNYLFIYFLPPTIKQLSTTVPSPLKLISITLGAAADSLTVKANVVDNDCAPLSCRTSKSKDLLHCYAAFKHKFSVAL